MLKMKKWHYLAAKKLSALLREITSKFYGDFYCLNCLQSFATEAVCGNINFCNAIIPSEDTKIEFNQNQKSNKAPFIIYTDLECIIEKIDRCKNNPENSSRTKVSEHIASGSLVSTISSFRSIENKHRDKDCIKRFCEFLREHTMKIINLQKKKNEVINKRAAGMILKCKNLLYL